MISVCLASFNGEEYIRLQIESILRQLSDEDELIISDDGSSDRTVHIIQSIGDRRIKLYQNHFHSPINNFEFLLGEASGDIIITSDQDDLWLEGRVSEVEKMHNEKDVQLIICKCQTINGEGKVLKESFYSEDDPVSHSLLHNLWKNPYLGCCLSMTKEVIPYILPFPPKIAMHDIWEGLVVQAFFKVAYYGERPLVQYRRHGDNFTTLHKYPISYKIQYRYYFLKELIKRKFKMRRYRSQVVKANNNQET